MNNHIRELSGSSLTASRSRRLWTIFILGALSTFAPLSIDMYLPALPSLANDLHTSASLTQLSLTACLLGLSLGQLLAGPLSDVRGRRMPLLVGLAGYTVSSLLCALTPSIWSLIFLRFIQGFMGSAGIVISRAVVRDLYSGAEMMKFTAMLMLVNGAGPILAPIIGGQLLKITNWEGVFFVLTGAGLLMFLAALSGLPESLPENRRSRAGLTNTLATFRLLLKDPVFMSYALPQGLVAAGMFAYISGSPFVIQDIFGASPQAFSLIFAINGLGIIIAGQITGKLAEKVNGKTLFISGLVLPSLGGIVLLIAILMKAGLFAILTPLFLVVSSVGIVGPAGSALAMENYGHSAGSASALLGLLSMVIGAFVAPLVGLGGSNTAVPMGIIIAASDVGSLVIYFILKQKGLNKEFSAPGN